MANVDIDERTRGAQLVIGNHLHEYGKERVQKLTEKRAKKENENGGKGGREVLDQLKTENLLQLMQSKEQRTKRTALAGGNASEDFVQEESISLLWKSFSPMNLN